jgi:hypothetical protein
MSALLLTACWRTGSESKPPAPIIVQPRPLPCLPPGPQPTVPDRLGLEWRADESVYVVQRKPVSEFWDYVVRSWEWMDNAETFVACATAVTP